LRANTKQEIAQKLTTIIEEAKLWKYYLLVVILTEVAEESLL
jgi:hypothetical protein